MKPVEFFPSQEPSVMCNMQCAPHQYMVHLHDRLHINARRDLTTEQWQSYRNDDTGIFLSLRTRTFFGGRWTGGGEIPSAFCIIRI